MRMSHRERTSQIQQQVDAMMDIREELVLDIEQAEKTLRQQKAQLQVIDRFLEGSRSKCTPDPR